ncbi:MAG: hypothetical protein ACLS61_16945 [Ruminococcus sp.]
MMNYGGCVFAVTRPRHPSDYKCLATVQGKKNQHSEEYLADENEFLEKMTSSVYTDPETGEIVCKVIPKDMDAELGEKAERAAQLTKLLRDLKGFQWLHKLPMSRAELISMPEANS